MPEKTSSRHRVFDLFAPFYDLGIWLAALLVGGEKGLRAPVVEAAGPLENKRVLELFAGTASLSVMAAGKGARATAVDLSPGMLRVAGEKARKAGVGLGRIVADAAELPIGSGLMDTVIASLGLHETAQPGVPGIMVEAARVLRPGGRLVIFDFHRAGGRAGWVQKLFFTFFEDESAWAWLSTDVQTLLREAGLTAFNRTYSFSGAFQLITVRKRG